MNLKQLLSRHTINSISRINARFLSSHPSCYGSVHGFVLNTNPISPLPHINPSSLKPSQFFTRYIHSGQETIFNGLGGNVEAESDDGLVGEVEEEDESRNEFLSRFVWIMRGKLKEVYTDCDKKTIDEMLLIIVGKVVSEMEKGGFEHMIESNAATPSKDFSEDLWRTVWEVSNMVLIDMEKAKKKEKMKKFLQAEKVKEMVRFAGEAGIRGDLLRELRFKWAREEMEESEFYEHLEQLRLEAAEGDYEESETKSEEGFEDKSKVVYLPKRSGKIKYKIYGLDLSGPKWEDVCNKIEEVDPMPENPKPITGKCKITTEKILSLQEDEDPSPIIAEWTELLQPSRIDWVALLNKLKEQNVKQYFKIAELVLGEESFQASIRDYSKLIDSHTKQNRIEDAERILKKMNTVGILPDTLTFITMVHMHSKAGNLARAIEAYRNLIDQGFRPDANLYTSMILAYVNANQPKAGEALMREMETRDIKPTEEIYMALLRSFSQKGDTAEAVNISTTMDFAGFPQSQESCALLVEAYGRSGQPEEARKHFDEIIKLGHKTDDKCIASMLAAYEKGYMLDKALDLLLQLEKEGIELGVATYSVLVDWLGEMQLLDEAEQVLGKVAELGESPPLDVHLSLCNMYSRAGIEKKALQALGVLEARKEELKPQQFERIVDALLDGGFLEDAKRMHELMVGQGFFLTDKLKIKLTSRRALNTRRPTPR